MLRSGLKRTNKRKRCIGSAFAVLQVRLIVSDGHPTDDRTTNDGTVSVGTDRGNMRGGCDSKARSDRRVGHGTNLLHACRDLWRIVAFARDSGAREQVDKSS